MECFNKVIEFFYFVIKGFIVVVVMEFLGVQLVDAIFDVFLFIVSDRRDFLMLLVVDIVNMIYEKLNIMEIFEDELV